MIPARTSTVITHIAAWIFFLSLPVLFVNSRTGDNDLLSILSSPYTWLFFITYILIFYLNAWFLLPKLYQEKKYFLYGASILVLVLAVWTLKPFDRLVNSRHHDAGYYRPAKTPGEDFGEPGPPRWAREFPPDQLAKRSPKVDVVSIFLFIMILAMSAAIQIRQRLRIVEQRALKAETDKANAELSFLKAQINPHFLFNTLNNIYSLAVGKSDHTAESIMKLSNIMRYITDDSREEYVPLENEVAFISDYIDLQRLRLGDKTTVGFFVSGKITGRNIAPLILMTFVENVFKYGISKHEPSVIEIQLTAAEGTIRFSCQNKLYAAGRHKESTGIGIDNTRRRLQHLYPGKHELAIKMNDGKYTVLFTLHD